MKGEPTMATGNVPPQYGPPPSPEYSHAQQADAEAIKRAQEAQERAAEEARKAQAEADRQRREMQSGTADHANRMGGSSQRR